MNPAAPVTRINSGNVRQGASYSKPIFLFYEVVGTHLFLIGAAQAWYYFRIGYGTYLTFLLGFATTLVTVYYLVINNISFLKVTFPSFLLFSILALAVGVPLAIFMSPFHFKLGGKR